MGGGMGMGMGMPMCMGMAGMGMQQVDQSQPATQGIAMGGGPVRDG